MAKGQIKTVAASVKKWQTNTSAAVDAYKAGVQAVTEAPGAKAAAQKDAYIKGTAAKADKFAAKVGAVTLEYWKSQTLKKGANNIPAGVDNATQKMTTFMGKLLPYIASQRQELNNTTPRGERGSAKNKARLLSWFDRMSKFSSAQ